MLTEERLVSMIRTAADEVFATMLGISLEPRPHHSEPDGNQPVDGVIALVGLAGSWVGAGRISCSAPLACKLSGALLASEYTAVNDDVLDAMAEITNMVIGNVKSTLEDELGPMGLSIPTVIFGRNYQARSCGVREWAVIPFGCEQDELEIRFALVRNERADAHRHAALHGVG